MAKYLEIDLANLYFRCLRSCSGDAFTQSSLAIHIVLNSINNAWRHVQPDHIVFAAEGRSWRRDIYPRYKNNRDVKKALMTPSEQENAKIHYEAFDGLIEFLKTKTNTTFLQVQGAEGDDFIARWIDRHPNDQHVILSSDTDFVQLVKHNVQVYDGMKDLLISENEVSDVKGNKYEFNITSSGKIKIGKKLKLNESFEPQKDWVGYALFLKCIRGDAGDGVFSAYPRANIRRLNAAWDDRKVKGYDWNNLMLQRWVDEDKNERLVKDEYEMNVKLIDLSQQPDYVIKLLDDAIDEQINKPRVSGVGIHFMRFCGANNLVNISKQAASHSSYLNAAYPGEQH